MPKSVAEITTIFSDVLDSLKTFYENGHKSVINEGGSTNLEPVKDDWSGDLTDYDGMSKAFDREDLHELMRKAIKDADNPGTLGDLPSITLQGEYVTAFEQAYRARHCTQIRASMHAAARMQGNSLDTGVLMRAVKNYLETLIKVSKEDS